MVSEKQETKADTAFDYDRAVQAFDAAMRMLHEGKLGEAAEQFDALGQGSAEEPHLAERARSYAAICRRRMQREETAPQTAEERYRHAVMLANAGNTEGAIRLLNQALEDHPTSPHYLYARASAYALASDSEAALRDLRQAVHYDPALRFLAVNDSDFERIREEPGFIDIIEPTSGGA